MNEEAQISYYAIIPALVRYDKKLKPAEKLLYGEITSLANSLGFCYATNKYFADLYEVSAHTVSQWVSHLEELGYVNIELIKGDKKEIKQRRIYIVDAPYVRKDTYPYIQKDIYPYVSKNTYPMYEKVQENNKDYNIDDLFYIIINSPEKISEEFYKILDKLEFIYPNEILENWQEKNIQKLKNIIYVLYNIYSSNFNYLISAFKREDFVDLYTFSEKHNPNNFINYYEKAIINKYLPRRS